MSKTRNRLENERQRGAEGLPDAGGEGRLLWKGSGGRSHARTPEVRACAHLPAPRRVFFNKELDGIALLPGAALLPCFG